VNSWTTLAGLSKFKCLYFWGDDPIDGFGFQMGQHWAHTFKGNREERTNAQPIPQVPSTSHPKPISLWNGNMENFCCIPAGALEMLTNYIRHRGGGWAEGVLQVGGLGLVKAKGKGARLGPNNALNCENVC